MYFINPYYKLAETPNPVCGFLLFKSIVCVLSTILLYVAYIRKKEIIPNAGLLDWN